ncbi:MAG: hypothetical protein JWN39_1808 [Ilumatobacteraceae bacterium]|nr:hypothetical protein [Ilumatobacteraceae bacterium]
MASTFSGVVTKILGKLGRPKPPTAHGPAGTAPPRSTHGAPSTDTTLSGVTVEYNPDLDGNADPGEVVWTWVPWEEDPNQGKDRPVVIVGRKGSMLVGVPLTSKHHDNERQVAVGTGPWDREGRPSYAKLDRILDVDPSQVRREGSILDRKHFDQIIAALRAG